MYPRFGSCGCTISSKCRRGQPSLDISRESGRGPGRRRRIMWFAAPIPAVRIPLCLTGLSCLLPRSPSWFSGSVTEETGSHGKRRRTDVHKTARTPLDLAVEFSFPTSLSSAAFHGSTSRGWVRVNSSSSRQPRARTSYMTCRPRDPGSC